MILSPVRICFPGGMRMNRRTAAAFGALAGAMLVFPGQAAEAALQGADAFVRAVLPALGPYMVCMLMVTSRVSAPAWALTGLGWLCGSPGGAKLLQPLDMTDDQALRCAAVSGTMSPLFFVGALARWLGDESAGWLMLLCHLAGAALLALALPAKGKIGKATPSPLPLGKALGETALTLGGVCLCVMLGSAAARMACCALPRLPAWASAALQCALEITGGAGALIDLHLPGTLPLLCAACSFGGLSILLQNAAIWRESGVGFGKLLALRSAHALLSGGLCWALTRVLY